MQSADASKATWRSGYAAVCKTVYPGSIPGVASNKIKHLAKAVTDGENHVNVKSTETPAGAFRALPPPPLARPPGTQARPAGALVRPSFAVVARYVGGN